MLRSGGDHDAAEQVRAGELTQALATLRATGGGAPDAVDAHVAAILTVERDRVANAALVAEFLAPLLADRLDAPSSAPPSGAAKARCLHQTAPASKLRRRPADIAGFIDDMLAQDRTLAERRVS